jgi:hypothetical protein
LRRDTLNAASKFVTIRIVQDGDESDSSHALVTGYEAFNDQVAEALAKIVIASFPAHS